jgi:hypothetical protein
MQELPRDIENNRRIKSYSFSRSVMTDVVDSLGSNVVVVVHFRRHVSACGQETFSCTYCHQWVPADEPDAQREMRSHMKERHLDGAYYSHGRDATLNEDGLVTLDLARGQRSSLCELRKLVRTEKPMDVRTCLRVPFFPLEVEGHDRPRRFHFCVFCPFVDKREKEVLAHAFDHHILTVFPHTPLAGRVWSGGRNPFK